MNDKNSGNMQKELCPMRKTIKLLSGKWRSRVIYELCQKPCYRFGELKKVIPEITNNMLTVTLRDLEEFEIVQRVQFNEIPPHVEYSLTDKGRDLIPIFKEISKWSHRHWIPEKNEKIVCSDCVSGCSFEQKY